MYITKRRFKGKCLCGNVNIPYGTQCELKENIIYYNDKPICLITSQNAYDYFSKNLDGCGLKRGKLIKEIQDILSQKDDKHQDRWDKLWDDEYVHKFRRQEIDDYWLWSFEFYNAEIKDLEYILYKIKEV